MAGILSQNPDVRAQATNFVHLPSTPPMVFQLLSIPTNSGPRVTFNSILQFKQFPELLGPFLASLTQLMNLNAGSKIVNAISGVSLSAVSALPVQPDMLSFPGLCTMTQIYDTSAHIAHSLCHRLSEAEEAQDRGNAEAQVDALDGYRDEVAEQAQKSLTQHQVDVLTTLAEALYPNGRRSDQ